MFLEKVKEDLKDHNISDEDIRKKWTSLMKKLSLILSSLAIVILFFFLFFL